MEEEGEGREAQGTNGNGRGELESSRRVEWRGGEGGQGGIREGDDESERENQKGMM